MSDHDEARVLRLEALGPVPGCEHRPAGLTRLLALRMQAIRRMRRCFRPHERGANFQTSVLAQDLGMVLLDYLAAEGIPVEIHDVIASDEHMKSTRGVVPLAPLGRLVPGALAQLGSAPQDNRLPGILRMPVTLMSWALAGELHRIGGDKDTITPLVEHAKGLDPTWIEVYPELRRDFGPPPTLEPPAEPQRKPQDGKLVVEAQWNHRRKRAPKAVHEWIVADEGRLLERRKEFEALKARRHMTEIVLTDLAMKSVRQLPISTTRHADAVERLALRFPNFEPVCRWVADQIRLCAVTRTPLRMPPTLLLGPPGIGKTMFCHELAGVLGADICLRSLAEASASFLITGASTQWTGGKPGVVAEHLSHCPVDRMPWFIFDELDKATGDREYPIGPALLGLLEPYTAQRFRDEALEIEMDIRPAFFWFTANELDKVRPELISRLHVIEVRAPTAFEMPTVVASVDTQLRKERPELEKVFAPLDTAVLLHLNAVAPRELRRVLQAGYACAIRRPSARRGRRSLRVDDLHSVWGGTPDAERVLH